MVRARHLLGAVVAAVLAATGLLVVTTSPATAATIQSSITINAPANAVPGQPFTISGSVSPGNATNTRTVVLKRRLENGTWQDPYRENTFGGSWSFNAEIPAGDSSACFAAYVRQRTIPNGNTWSWATTSMVCVYDYPAVTSSISLNASTTTPAPNQTVTLSGIAQPANASNLRQVVLKMQTPGVGTGWQDDVAEVTTNAGGGYSFSVQVPEGDNHRCFATYVRQKRSTGGPMWSYAASSSPICLDQNNNTDTLALSYLSPKIVETADRSGPESSDAAAQLGRLQWSTGPWARTILLQVWDGSSWVNTGEQWNVPANSSGFKYPTTPLWSGSQYRAIIRYDTGLDLWTSPLTGGGDFVSDFTDEFSGPINHDVWQMACANADWGGSTETGNCFHGHLDPADPSVFVPDKHARQDWSTVSVSGGVLSLSPLAGTGCVLGDGDPTCYLTSLLQTTGPVVRAPGSGNSWVAARIRFQNPSPGSAGQWTSHGAFWTNNGPDGENDWAEYFGGNNMKQNFYGGPSRIELETSTAAAELPTGQTWYDTYHIFAVRSTSAGYAYFIDGKQVQTVTAAEAGHAQSASTPIRLSMLVEDYQIAHGSPLGQHMDVDWVRAWHN